MWGLLKFWVGLVNTRAFVYCISVVAFDDLVEYAHAKTNICVKFIFQTLTIRMCIHSLIHPLLDIDRTIRWTLQRKFDVVDSWRQYDPWMACLESQHRDTEPQWVNHVYIRTQVRRIGYLWPRKHRMFYTIGKCIQISTIKQSYNILVFFFPRNICFSITLYVPRLYFNFKAFSLIRSSILSTTCTNMLGSIRQIFIQALNFISFPAFFESFTRIENMLFCFVINLV